MHHETYFGNSGAMQLILVVPILILAIASTTLAQPSAPAYPLKSSGVCLPALSAETKREMEARLGEARARFEENPNDPETIIWLGRRTAYLGRFSEAIAVYTRGIHKFPRDARLYRHRGHRHITLRHFELAIKDLENAASLITRRRDEAEPDGLPNVRNIPTSTLNSNIWYHLGLAYYLSGDFKKALAAYRECLKFSTNPDMLSATSHWLYMTLRRLDRPQEAKRVLAAISAEMDIIENHDYHRLLLMYQGGGSPETLLEEAHKSASALSFPSVGYGVGNWYLYHNRREEAARIFRIILGSSSCASFGYIAAEAEMKRLK